MKKILFITPPYHCGVVEVAGRWVPLTFVYLAGAARKAGFEPVIYDAMTKRHGYAEIESRIFSERPDVVATTAITSTTPDALEVLRIAKKVDPEIVTLIGGVHPSFLYGEVLNHGSVDYVVRGEGEETLIELLRVLDNGADVSDVRGIAWKTGHKIISTPERPFIEDLDSLDTAWDLVEWSDYRYFVVPRSRLGAVSTSRGCNHGCTFCSQQKFWRQSWRGRRPENVVKEIIHLHETYGVNVVLLPDEYPTKDRERWERILDLMIEADTGVLLLMETRAGDIIRDRDILYKYRKAGIVHIYIGVEATDQDTLDLIKKDINVETGAEAIRLIHEHGMITETSFILGFPHETKSSVRKTLELSKYYNPDFAHYLALAPWPYADMYREMAPHVAVKDYRKYNLIDPVIKPVDMSMKEVDRAIVDCYQSFYMGKLGEILLLKDEFKRDYILHSMKLIMNSSFIVDKLGSLGKIPPQVEALLRKLDRPAHIQSPGHTEVAPKVTRSIIVHRPVAEVFDFVADPTSWTKYISGLVDVRNISSPRPEQGMEFEWTYRIRGITLNGKGKIVEFDRERKLVLQMHSMFPIRKTLFFEGIPQGSTRLTVEVSHHVQGKVLNFLFRAAMKTVNVMEATRVLERIKALCEGTEEPGQACTESKAGRAGGS